MWSATAAIWAAVSGRAVNGSASGSVARVRGTDAHGLAGIAPSTTATSRIRRKVANACLTVDRVSVTSSASASVMPFGRAWAGSGSRCHQPGAQRTYVGSGDRGNGPVAQRLRDDVAPVVGPVVGQHAGFDLTSQAVQPGLRVVAQRPVTGVALCGRGLAARDLRVDLVDAVLCGLAGVERLLTTHQLGWAAGRSG